MRQHIIKDKLRDALKGQRVRAAVFYTFNFNPSFFENYIMPLMVPNYEFNNNKIHNHITWRRAVMDGALPAVTIYFDDRAKSLSNAPLLDYELRPTRIKGSAFHPKVGLLLSNDGRLILLIGSNNMTKAGYCDNIECYSVVPLDKNDFYSNSINEGLKSFIRSNAESWSAKRGERAFSRAEKQVFAAIPPRGGSQGKITFYHSRRENFSDFINKNIFHENNAIKDIEILSPFISPSNSFLETLAAKAEIVRLLIPVRYGKQVQLSKRRFLEISRTGLQWALFKDEGIDPNRYNHGKIYRFYSNEKIHTFIGSVNLTEQGWKSYSEGGNVEAGILFVEEAGNAPHLLEDYHMAGWEKDWEFKEETDGEDYEGVNIFKDSPDIDFTLDWRTRKIEYESKWHARCRMVLADDLVKRIAPYSKGEQGFAQHPVAQRALAQNPLIKVLDGNGSEHFFYPRQKGAAKRPLGIKMSESDIFKMWELSGDPSDNRAAALIERFSDIITKEDGSTDDDEVLVSEGILNKMAAHISALILLEKKLFHEKDKAKRHRNVIYYLTCHNIDTLPHYRERLGRMVGEGNINKGFYWILLQIIRHSFYHRRSKLFNKTQHRQAYNDLDFERKKLSTEIKAAEKSMDLVQKREHLAWAREYFRQWG